MNVIETSGLGKRYGNTWALRECTLAIPAGHMVALVGPNGAGKTTLLNLAVGLTAPTAGTIRVLGEWQAGSPAALDGIAFVAQDMPLYKNLSAADLLHLTRNLNRRFDRSFAEARLGDLGIPLKRKAGAMSGGQQAQLALTLALARRPRLLVLDEPMATLDPLARHDFMATVMAAMVDDGVSVLLSSHVLTELERVADYLVDGSRWRAKWTIYSHTTAYSPARRTKPTDMTSAGTLSARDAAQLRLNFWSEQAEATRLCRRDGKRTRSDSRNSRSHTCASRAPPHSLARRGEQARLLRRRRSDHGDCAHGPRTTHDPAAGVLATNDMGHVETASDPARRGHRHVRRGSPLPLRNGVADSRRLRNCDGLPPGRFVRLSTGGQ
jgi:ABC-2 type transport system ATP-binding protein